MDVAALQHELELLSADQQDRVAAFLTALRLKREGIMSEIQQRLDDNNPKNWISWEDAKSELGLDEEDGRE